MLRSSHPLNAAPPSLLPPRILFGYVLVVLAILLPASLPFACHQSANAGWLVLGATLLTHAALLYGTLRPNNQLFGPVQTGFSPTRGDEVWLTVDDGPDPHDTPRLLALLAAAGAQATFFVRGDRARAHPELLAAILAGGHTLGNHTDTHPQATFWCLGPRRMRREIDGCSAALQRLTGTRSTLFRAPVGMVNPFVHPAAAARGLRLVGWSARGFDGVSDADPAGVVRLILADLRPGGIALLHEGRPGISVPAMGLLLAELQTRRWRAILPQKDEDPRRRPAPLDLET